MRLAAVSLVAVLALGCAQDVSVTDRGKELIISPALTDLGVVPVGMLVEFELQLDSKSGDITLRNLNINNIEGAFFAYTEPDEPVIVPNKDATTVLLQYLPQDVGYHRAVITLTSDAAANLGDELRVDVRAQGVAPDASCWPLALDFGPVDQGVAVSLPVTCTNHSDLEMTLTDAVSDNDVFGNASPLPQTIAPGKDFVFNVVFQPDGPSDEAGSLSFKMGRVALPSIALRGNDCANGNPDAYDADGDGYTLCGGDCDDSAAGVHPGAPETADEVDEDCDGVVDEGTDHVDDDGDGYCDNATTCIDGSLPGDCNDVPTAGVDIHPGFPENMTNGVDDDCDGVVDFGTSDVDGDGYAPDATDPTQRDCDDSDPLRFPFNTELPDRIDNDCDGVVDEGTTYFDDDGDGYCEDATLCSDGSLPGDCNDDLASGADTNPAASELADWQDNNCDGTVDEGTENYDDDGDGFTEVGGDCDDNDAANNPAMGNTCSWP